MKISKESWIILGFAFLHAAVALGCRLAGLADDMMLTLLTMLLVVILCLRSNVSGMFMAIAVVAVNIVGVLLGRGTAWLFDSLDSPLLIFPLSTFVSTIIIGWGTFAIARSYARRHPVGPERATSSLKWLLIAFVVILVTRLAILLLFSESWEGHNVDVTILLDYAVTLAVVVAVAEYALRLQTRARVSSEQANLAQYRYHTLKQQVNPHFLFNSLNVLDNMILEQPREEASRYTHKLAEIYRYMITSENQTMVRLREELEFVEHYIDLLKVRFPEGLEVQIHVAEAALDRWVVPCCVQLLLENATKHNAVQAARPLCIRIQADEQSVEVTNNRVPRMTRPHSTGLGLEYIRQQYRDLSGKTITVRTDEHSFTVILPLL